MAINKRIARFVFSGLLFLPGAAWAQQASSIAGVVRDASGAVIPGVTVEAASPTLIEKVRSVVTDSAGQYKVEELRPGTYTVTFSLTGFSTFKRDGVVLTSGFTATVNVDLKVGTLDETVTVSGTSPLVDVANVKQGTIVSDELLSSLPSGGKGYSSLARLIPGMNQSNDSGGANGLYVANQSHLTTLHGKGAMKLLYDGMQTQNLCTTGYTSYIQNPSTVEETTIETGGGSAESTSSGVQLNMIPKEGGNRVTIGASGTFANDKLQGNNLSADLAARGIRNTNGIQHLYDENFTIGGPIKKDKIWFFAATRGSGNQNLVAGAYFNSTQGTPFYTPDLSRPAYRREWLKSQGQRITWQISPRNKVSAFADVQSFQVRGTGALVAPESQTAWSFWPNGLYQATWNSPVSSKLLLEGGFSFAQGGYTFDQCSSTDIFGFCVKKTDISIFDAGTGVRYNAATIYDYKNDQNRYAARYSASYITGTHAFKAGVQYQHGIANLNQDRNQDQLWTFVNTKPTLIDQYVTPYEIDTRFNDYGFFAQDKWTIKRLTLSPGLRFDYFNGYAPATHEVAGQFMSARDFPAVNNAPNWYDLNPRIGAAYDLFGDGKTALKGSLGRYVGKIGTAVALQLSGVQSSIIDSTRSWTDTNGDYIPQCDLKNYAANGECGPIANASLGQANNNAIAIADNLIHGFGTRDYLWDATAEITQQLGAKTSVTAGYYRNWSNQFGSQASGWPTGVLVDTTLAANQVDRFCVTAPVDSRLPNGGGYQVCGLADRQPAHFVAGPEIYQRADQYGGQRRESDFFTFSFQSRLGNGNNVGGSLDTGRTVEDHCYAQGYDAVIALAPPPTSTAGGGTPVIDFTNLLYCHVVTPFNAQTQLKLYGSYNLPMNFVVSGVFQNVSGITFQANRQYTNAEISPSLGRNLAACGTAAVCNASITVPLVAPQTLFQPRRNMLDLRVSKVFTAGHARIRANLDLYNATNSQAILAITSTYGANWQLPSGSGSIMNARYIQIGGEFSF
jgi:hypothetical protein